MRSSTGLLSLLAGFGLACAHPSRGLIDSELQAKLSTGASISHDASVAPRWSEYGAPHPGTVVSVATEADVQATVQYLVKKNIPFLAQNGGHGWSGAFTLGQNGVLINLRGLNSTTFSADKTQVTIGGGAAIHEVIEQAYANDVQVLTGNCNCVGALGAGLGGGYGNLVGLYGLAIDNYLSFNVVLANGSLVTITPAQEDLWWALRGAGPNFGIVTSAVMKSTPMKQADNTAWTGGLWFTEDKIEKVTQAIEDLKLEAPMNIFLYFLTSNGTPTVLVTVFYFGTEAEGRAAFKSILDIGPYSDTTAVLPQSQWNAGADGFCTKGGRKPTYSAGFNNFVPTTWRQIWNDYNQFLTNPNTSATTVVVECYSLEKTQSFGSDSASFANRDIRFNGFTISWYPDASLDAKAEAFGSGFRDLLRADDGLSSNRTYVNFAFGDEENQEVYNDSTSRLQQLKKKYDPYNVFNQWFDL
ncbi:FAD-binding domain-containing protein [Annulohypoxylon maeteangense]|uniref:FAD-binding domain-containing protein n=1 Tax=Annulohypoxylon maeteangense TaxID=1927788 RepID=UPI00200848D5|nr:FAD-binding domain-containing protein [Annulohypoxylon maeteangense]KAI0883032.1 FAD-binding domain-containing protein [Annulohypoxylon maeteangense]